MNDFHKLNRKGSIYVKLFLNFPKNNILKLCNFSLLNLSILLNLSVGLGALVLTGCTKKDTKTESVTELKIEDLTPGSGIEATDGKSVTVHYTGTLTDGTKFDSSHDHQAPFTFTLGAGQVIRGWDEGVKGMKVGGKRKLIIPPSFGYGAEAKGPIPANSTLIFEVELLGVQ